MQCYTSRKIAITPTESSRVDRQTITVGTAFSGIGAVEHALRRMGVQHQIAFACDNDRFVKQSYFANYGIDDARWADDVRDVSGSRFRGQVDLLVAGSPCQSFSMVGRRAGFMDERGSLFYEFLRLIEEVRPDAFIFENVKGVINNDRGRTWARMREAFSQTGYRYYDKVLNAKDYGIPQNRERLFVVGFLNDREYRFPDPIPLEIAMQDLLEDDPAGKYYLGVKGIDFVTNPKNIQKRYTQINGRIALCQKANQQFNWHGDFVFEPTGEVPDKYYLSDKVARYVLQTGTKNYYSKPEIDLTVARPILATMHKMHRAGVDNYISRAGRIRKLTPRECLRLMGFDDTFRIVVSDTQMYRQAGNSVVVNILIHLLESMGIGGASLGQMTLAQATPASALFGL